MIKVDFNIEDMTLSQLHSFVTDLCVRYGDNAVISMTQWNSNDCIFIEEEEKQ